MKPCGSDQAFHLAPLRGIGRKSAKEILSRRVGFGPSSGAGEGNRQVEAREMKIRVDGERALERCDGVGRMATVREHDPEVRAHDGIVRFDALRLA